MVKPLLKTTLREIQKSLGRFLAIMAIVGLGVGFFAGLRMCQPTMEATGVKYLEARRFYDFRLMSTLGFTDDDVAEFLALDGIETARGSVYTEFLYQKAPDEDAVLMAHSLTETVNESELISGRYPESGNECLVDLADFTAEDIGSVIQVSADNDPDTLELLRYDEYTIVGLARSPLYLNYERGTASIGNGSVESFVLIPEDGFDFEAYHEIYLEIEDPADAYSDEYEAQIDAMKPQIEEFLVQRADIRYETLYANALDEIHDGEQEVADGWVEYRQKRADAEQELADALIELDDGEQEYLDGIADYEQALIDYEEAIADFEQGKIDYAEGKLEYEDGLKEYQDGLKEYEDGMKELEDAAEELESAKRKLSSASRKLAAAREELETGEAAYDQLKSLYDAASQIAASPEMQAMGVTGPSEAIAVLGSLDPANPLVIGWDQAEAQIGQPLTSGYLSGVRDQLDYGWSEYNSGYAKYKSGRSKYNKGVAEYNEGKQELEDAWIELEDARVELEDAEKELKDASQELIDGVLDLAEGRAELDKVPGELADARQELDDGWIEYYNGVEEAKQEFIDAEAELRDGEQEILDAYEDLNDLKPADTYTLTRNENAGYACFDNDISIIAAISLVFPVFFFLVAALVCTTTMKRMVEEQRTQIGVLKALGYSRHQIIGKYLFYSGSAAITGSVAGYALGSRGLPLIIWEIYGIMYDFAPLENVFDPLLALLSFGAALICSMGATYVSCQAELSRPAAELLRPKAPKAGKRIFLEYITPLWKRLSFLRKVSVRNVLRYRSRLIMMLLGIGGCTALLITGFGIRDSIGNLAEDQYDQITIYDYAVNFTDPLTPEQSDSYLTGLGWSEDQGILVHSGSTDVMSDTASESVYLVVPYGNTLEGFIDLHDDQGPVPFPKTGEIVINIGLTDDLNVGLGDSLTIRDDDLGSVTVTVSGIVDNYIDNYIFVSPDTYFEQLGTAPDFKTLFLLGNEGADPYAESVLLSDSEDVSNVTVNDSSRERISEMLSRLNILIVVVVACAGALAFIVLFNLTNINITERIREIATIKVLGFYQNEVASYVFREITMLSAGGSIVGLFMGKALHAFVMAQVQVDNMFFPVQIKPASYLISVALTMLFSFLITQFMKPRLNKIDMAESLKSIE
ncbi:MAG: FtsX-like permease family protein [Firmicutes bacterium]|nr:FtsX-like permease family protein [Bacillota bacterium]